MRRPYLFNHGAMIQVFLISDFQLLVQGLNAMLQSHPGRCDLLGSVGTLNLRTLPWTQPAPDVVLLDLDTDPAQVVPWLQHWRAPDSPKVLLLAGRDKPTLQGQAVLNGARGIVDRHCRAEQLLTAVEKVHQGQVWLDNGTTARLLSGLTGQHPAAESIPAALAHLSRREQQIVAMLLRHGGDSARMLAQRLNISESTLRNHLTSVYDKFGVNNRSGLMAHAMQNGLASKLST